MAQVNILINEIEYLKSCIHQQDVKLIRHDREISQLHFAKDAAKNQRKAMMREIDFLWESSHSQCGYLDDLEDKIYNLQCDVQTNSHAIWERLERVDIKID